MAFDVDTTAFETPTDAQRRRMRGESVNKERSGPPPIEMTSYDVSAAPRTTGRGRRKRKDTIASDRRKKSFYLPYSILEFVEGESVRLDRSLSWVVQRSIEIARTTLRKFPSSPG